MSQPRWADLPWPVMTVDARGDIQSSTPSLRTLLNLEEVTPEALSGRFEVLTLEGWPLLEGQLPWERAGRGEAFGELQVWHDRASGRRLVLDVIATITPSERVLLLRDESRCALAARVLDAHHQLALRVLRTEDAPAMAEGLIRQLAAILSADLMLLVAVSGAGPELLPLASFGLPPGVLPRGVRVGLGTGSLLERALALGTLEQLASPSRADVRQLVPLAPEHVVGMQVLGAQPLARGGRCVGLLVFGRDQPGLLSALEAQLLHKLAEVCVVGLGRAGEEEERRRAHRRLRALHEAAQALRAGLTVPDLMRRLVTQACELTGARHGALGLLDASHIAYDALVYAGVDTRPRMLEVGTAPLPWPGFNWSARPVRLATLPPALASAFPGSRPPEGGCLVVPLHIGEELLGHFYLADRERRDGFTDEDAEVMELFSVQAALAVGYAREVEQVDRQEHLLRAILQHAPDGILFCEAEQGRFTLVNGAAERLIGRPVLGIPLARRPDAFGLRHPDGRRYLAGELPTARALRGEEVTNEEVHITRPDGRRTSVFASAAPVRDEQGELLGAVLVLQDISAFRELERLREEVGAVIAHDLRSPIQSILLHIRQLQAHPERQVGPALARALERMRSSAERLSTMANELLDASRIEVQRFGLELAPASMTDAAREVVERMRPLFEGRPLLLEAAAELPPVLLDRLRFDQVLTNLVDNALKYGGAGPVRVQVRPDGNGVRVSVEDRGPGIAPEDLPRLFERYFQARRTRARRSGLGLGLYISRGFVEAHGGRIWAESQLGEGTIMHVWLPAAPSARTPQQWPARPAEEGAPGTLH